MQNKTQSKTPDNIQQHKESLAGTLARAGILLVALCVLYALLMTLAYIPGNARLLPYYEYSKGIIQEEGDEANGFGLHVRGAMLDFYTDGLMLDGAVKDEGQGALYNAMSVNNYARYWHGYMIVLRPLLHFFNYHEIRYMNIFFILGLLALAFAVLRARLGRLYAWMFLVSMCMVYVNVFPLSMQFTSAYAVAVAGIIARVWMDKYAPRRRTVLLFFLVLGSAVAFWDLLTVPLLSLGLPLVVSLGLEARRKPEGALRQTAGMAADALFWGLGYGATFFAKWVLASLVTGTNIIADALDTFVFRTGGGGQQISRAEVLLSNIRTLFKKKILVAIAVIALVVLVLAIIFRHRRGFVLRQLPLLLVGASPYVWYMLFSNHSLLHSYFTYRLQSVTVFAVGVFLFSLIDMQKLAQALEPLRRRWRALLGRM